MNRKINISNGLKRIIAERLKNISISLFIKSFNYFEKNLLINIILNNKTSNTLHIFNKINSSIYFATCLIIRWILLANHAEPVQGLIQRFLRRRLIQSQLLAKSRDGALERVVDWIPRCWAHLNKFLETHNFH